MRSVALLACLGAASAIAAVPSGEKIEFFEQQIRPVLAQQCWSCHGQKMQHGGLRLDSREAALEGGGRGAAVVPGDPARSVVIRALRHEGPEMPLGGRLSSEQVSAFVEWIEDGAPWPATKRTSQQGPSLEQRAREHWAFQPLGSASPPKTGDQEWTLTEVDAFIVAALQEAGLKPAAQADRRTLIRRLSFDLTGLPPRPEAVEAFVDDESPEAYRKLVDRLLDSQRFGEHWARHWMDWVRYCESHGSQGDFRLPMAWRYRDYLIRAFNADVSYDQMLLEYLAGDMLENPRINPDEGLNESILGLGNLRMVEYGYFPVDALDDQVKVVDNQIDVLSKAFQGLTVSCARCHDHKFDPIAQKDFYGLYGVFASSRHGLVTVDTPEVLAKGRDRLKDLRRAIKRGLVEEWSRLPHAVADSLRQARLSLDTNQRDSVEHQSVRIRALVEALAGDDLPEEHPVRAWLTLRAFEPDALTEQWDALREHWLREAEARREFNAKTFRQAWDLRDTGEYGDWFPHGPGLPAQPSESGEFRVPPEGETVIGGLLPAGVHTGLDSQKYGGIVGSPRFEVASDSISLRVAGGNFASARLVVENYPIGVGGSGAGSIHPAINLNDDRPRWLRLDTAYRKGQNAYIELETLDDRSRAYRRMPQDPEAAKEDGRSYFSVAEIVFHDGDQPPKEDPLAILHLLEGEPPTSLEELEQRFDSLARDAVQAWADQTLNERQAAFLDSLIRVGLLPNRLDELPALRDLVQAYREAEGTAPVPRRAPGVLPGTSYDQPLFRRGDHNSPAEPVRRGYLQFLRGEPFHTADSGRLELARELVREDNPLTARVLVNRLWYYLFGRGIVSTVDNFGSAGDRPSHPELLDFLAKRFMQRGWSVKDTIRYLVLSRTYQMSSAGSAQSRDADAENRLLQHQNFRRLPAESIRDSILEISGELDHTLYGPSIDVYYVGKTEGGGKRGPLDGFARRSIYQAVRRNAQNPFLEIFDAPKPSTTRGRRDVTNIPAQSLAMLNDPFVVDQAAKWADRTLADGSISPKERVLRMFRRALGREADAAETDLLMSSLYAFAEDYGLADTAVMGSQDLWKDFAQSMFNLKEFIYLK